MRYRQYRQVASLPTAIASIAPILIDSSYQSDSRLREVYPHILVGQNVSSTRPQERDLILLPEADVRFLQAMPDVLKDPLAVFFKLFRQRTPEVALDLFRIRNSQVVKRVLWLCVIEC